MVGLEVTPLIPSSRSRASSPEVMSWRRMLSSHSDWPMLFSSRIGSGMRTFVAMSLLAREQLGRRRHDVPCRDPGGVHELLRLAGRRQALDSEVGDVQAVFGRKRLEHCRAQAALRVMVLDDDKPAPGGARCLAQRLHVDWLDRVEVDDAGRDLLLGQ